jgi:hypothetical protein
MRLAICLAILLLPGCHARAATVDEAMGLYSLNKVPAAEEALRRISTDSKAPATERAAAHRELGRIAWLIDGDAPRALREIDAAFAAGGDRCETALQDARILQEARKGAELLRDAPRLAASCDIAERADPIRLSAAAAALDLAAEGGGRERLAEAKTLLASVASDTRTGLRACALELQLGLLQGEAPAALQAWKDYFWLSDRDVPQGLAAAVPAAAPLFEAGLAPKAPVQARLQLVDLLVRAGFAQAAERYAQASNLPAEAGAAPLWRKAKAYFDFRRQLEATILASNRRVARGGSAANLRAALLNGKKTLMGSAALSGDARQALRRAYGLFGTVGETDGYASIHLGHVVQDDRRVVEQYGHRAAVAFVAIDNMISNGFNSWLWDGTAAAGGWTEDGPTIVQVRPEYTSDPLNAWSLYSGGAARQRIAARAAARQAADLAALKERDVATLPGLADRLHIQVAEQVGARARAVMGPGGDLKRAFLQEYWRASFQHSIFIHEGRHALDKGLVTGVGRLFDNPEYRAKLSELALADYPRLPLASIDSQIGDGSAHGKANEKILAAFGEWTRAHGAQVKGFDPALPPLVQLDKLSDDQIRAIARGLDPLAGGGG